MSILVKIAQFPRVDDSIAVGGWVFCADFAQLTITRRDGSKHFVLVSPEDVDFCRGHVWCLNGSGRASAMIDGRNTEMHRAILNSDAQAIDHINHDHLDNRRCNLRECTQQQNSFNRRPHKGAAIKYKGVFPRKCSKKNPYRVRIRCGDKMHNLGGFSCPVEAAKAYDKKAIELHGEFACTNASLGLIQ